MSFSATANDAMRSFEVMAHGLTEGDLGDYAQLDQAIRAARAEEAALRARGEFTEAGLAKQPRPQREAALRQIGAYERLAETDQANLDATFEAIQAGRVVRASDGSFTQVRQSDATPIGEIRAGEIRAAARAMSRSERRALVIRAVQDNDQETLAALESAPRSLPALDSSIRTELRALRLEQSGYQAEHRRRVESVFHRRRIAEAARALVCAK